MPLSTSLESHTYLGVIATDRCQISFEESREISLEKYRGGVSEQYKDLLIYGTGLSRICHEFEENVVKLIIRHISRDLYSRWNAGLRGKSVKNHGDISEGPDVVFSTISLESEEVSRGT